MARRSASRDLGTSRYPMNDVASHPGGDGSCMPGHTHVCAWPMAWPFQLEDEWFCARKRAFKKPLLPALKCRIKVRGLAQEAPRWRPDFRSRRGLAFQRERWAAARARPALRELTAPQAVRACLYPPARDRALCRRGTERQLPRRPRSLVPAPSPVHPHPAMRN